MKHPATDVDVEAKLQQFTDALRESETYNRYLAAQERVTDDPEAMELIEQYKRQMGSKGDEPEEKKIDGDALEAKLSANETVAAYERAEAELIACLAETNERITDCIEDEFVATTGGESR